MNQEQAYEVTRNKSLTSILTEMGISKDSFMEFDLNNTSVKTTTGNSFGGWDDTMKIDKSAVTDGKYDVGITGSNNGVYAAYVPGGKYIVTKDPEVIQKLQTELGFKDKGLGVVFSNGDRPADPLYQEQFKKMENECARQKRNRNWESNRQEEAKIFDGVEIEGFKFSFGQYSETKDGYKNDYVGSVKTPDGKEVGITSFSGFHEDNKFGKMAEEFSSKEFEDKVYSGEVKKEEVMERLDGADNASQEFETSKKNLKEAKDRAAGEKDKLNAAELDKRSLDEVGSELSSTIENFKEYAVKNPKKAEKMYDYINDVIKSTANGAKPQTPNPMEPHGFFGKMKSKLLGQKQTQEESKLDRQLRNLQRAIRENPETVKESVNKDQFALYSLTKEVSEKRVAAENNVKACASRSKEADQKVGGAIYTVAHNALKAAKFNKLKESVSKIFGDKEAAKEMEQRSTARDTTGIKDTNANTGVDRLAEKAKAMEGLSPEQRLAKRMAEMRGTKKPDAPKPVVKREVDSNIMNRTMDNKMRA